MSIGVLLDSKLFETLMYKIMFLVPLVKPLTFLSATCYAGIY